ncbi:hypothetical protein K7J31_002881 [Vibrio parahaemolyticus]|nr:hypothetical protein [Vibrio parahaemolyticus]
MIKLKNGSVSIENKILTLKDLDIDEKTTIKEYLKGKEFNIEDGFKYNDSDLLVERCPEIIIDNCDLRNITASDLCDLSLSDHRDYGIHLIKNSKINHLFEAQVNSINFIQDSYVDFENNKSNIDKVKRLDFNYFIELLKKDKPDDQAEHPVYMVETTDSKQVQDFYFLEITDDALVKHSTSQKDLIDWLLLESSQNDVLFDKAKGIAKIDIGEITIEIDVEEHILNCDREDFLFDDRKLAESSMSVLFFNNKDDGSVKYMGGVDVPDADLTAFKKIAASGIEQDIEPNPVNVGLLFNSIKDPSILTNRLVVFSTNNLTDKGFNKTMESYTAKKVNYTNSTICGEFETVEFNSSDSIFNGASISSFDINLNEFCTLKDAELFADNKLDLDFVRLSGIKSMSYDYLVLNDNSIDVETAIAHPILLSDEKSLDDLIDFIDMYDYDCKYSITDNELLFLNYKDSGKIDRNIDLYNFEVLKFGDVVIFKNTNYNYSKKEYSVIDNEIFNEMLDMGLIEENPNNLVQEQENKSKNRKKIKP